MQRTGPGASLQVLTVGDRKPKGVNMANSPFGHPRLRLFSSITDLQDALESATGGVAHSSFSSNQKTLEAPAATSRAFRRAGVDDHLQWCRQIGG